MYSQKQIGAVKLPANPFKRVTLLTAAGYFFMFAVCAKGVSLYASQHPSKDQLLRVQGRVKDARLGGQGTATVLKIDSDHEIRRYSSYYGKVWPGMERIQREDIVNVLAERNKLSRNELITGKEYYIWELIHDDRVVIRYDDVRKLVQTKEATVNRYINLWLAVGSILLLAAYLSHVGEIGLESR